MLIRVGHELAFRFPQATAMVVLLYVHPSRVTTIHTPERFEAEPRILFGDNYFSVHAKHFDAGNDLDHGIDLQAGGFNQQTSHPLEQVATLLHGATFNQVLLRGGQDSIETNHEKFSN